MADEYDPMKDDEGMPDIVKEEKFGFEKDLEKVDRDRVLNLFKKQPEKEFTSGEILRELDLSWSDVKPTLIDLTNSGLVIKTGKKEYTYAKPKEAVEPEEDAEPVKATKKMGRPKVDLKPLIMEFLNEHKGELFSARAIARQIDQHYNSVNNYLKELKEEGKVEKYGWSSSTKWSAGPAPVSRPAKEREGTLNKKILNFLKQHSGEVISGPDIAKAIGHPRNLTSSALSYLKKNGKVTKVGKRVTARWGVDVSAQVIRMATKKPVEPWKKDEEVVPVIVKKSKRKYKKRKKAREVGFEPTKAPTKPYVKSCSCGDKLMRVTVFTGSKRVPTSLLVCLNCKKLYEEKIVEVSGGNS